VVSTILLNVGIVAITWLAAPSRSRNLERPVLDKFRVLNGKVDYGVGKKKSRAYVFESACSRVIETTEAP